MNKNIPTITSRRNGLKIAIPPQAKSLLGRFATQGDNQLVFNKPKGVIPADAKGGQNNSKATIESTTLSSKTKVTDLV